MTSVRAYRIFNMSGAVQGQFVSLRLEELDPGEVVVKVGWSSVNYKDALAATGAGRIIRRFPCIGGIDLAGTVVSSADARFHEGDAVVATGYDLGVAHDGGYADYCRVPAAWVVPLPYGMTVREAMALGTAGFTAGLAVTRMEHEGLRPDNGPVVVSGATGGVGSIAVDILAGRGYQVAALTGKDSQAGYLKRLGASQVVLRQDLDLTKIKPLNKAAWAGAIDNLGGGVLSWLMSTMQMNGTLASVGLAASASFEATVMPFILRGVSVLGINSADTLMPLRQKVWERLATDLKPRHLYETVRAIPFEQLPTAFEPLLKAHVVGRTIIDIGTSSAI